jgi:hypothetical protein
LGVSLKPFSFYVAAFYFETKQPKMDSTRESRLAHFGTDSGMRKKLYEEAACRAGKLPLA